jgi:hypothetical protein
VLAAASQTALDALTAEVETNPVANCHLSLTGFARGCRRESPCRLKGGPTAIKGYGYPPSNGARLRSLWGNGHDECFAVLLSTMKSKALYRLRIGAVGVALLLSRCIISPVILAGKN